MIPAIYWLGASVVCAVVYSFVDEAERQKRMRAPRPHCTCDTCKAARKAQEPPPEPEKENGAQTDPQ